MPDRVPPSTAPAGDDPSPAEPNATSPPPDAPTDRSDTLTARTVRGMKWSYLSTFVHSVLQIGFSALLARLLEPAAFGLVALAGVVLNFGSYFAKMGIASAVVQKETLSREEVHAAFLLSTGLGILFFGAMWVAAPAAALLFDETSLVPIVRALALSFLITGIETSASSLLRRRLDFRSLALISILSYLLGYGAVGVPMAYTGYGVWSLVAASLTKSLIHAILVHATVRHGVSWVRTGARYRYFFSFGSRVSINGFLEFLGGNLDTMTIGRYIGAGPLGLYNRAYMLAFVPLMKLGSGLSKVLLPSLSRLQSDTPRLRRVYLAAIGVLGAVIAPTCAGMMVVSTDIVMVLLGDQWTGAVPVLRVLALAVCFNLLTHLAAVTCEATARLNIKIQIQVLHIGLLVLFFWLLFDYGLVGIAIGFLMAECVRHVAYALTVHRALEMSWANQMRAYGPALTNALVIGGVLYGVSAATTAAGWPLAGRFALELGVSALLLAGLILYGPLASVRDDIGRMLDRLAPGPVTTRLVRLFPPPSQ